MVHYRHSDPALMPFVRLAIAIYSSTPHSVLTYVAKRHHLSLSLSLSLCVCVCDEFIHSLTHSLSVYIVSE